MAIKSDGTTSRPPAGGREGAEAGLPDEAALLALASTYLAAQGRLWPDLVRAGVIPEATAGAAAGLAAEFRARFRGRGGPAAVGLPDGAAELGAAYVRASPDAGDGRPLDRQLTAILEKAARDRAFVPWSFVSADATTAGRTRV